LVRATEPSTAPAADRAASNANDIPTTKPRIPKPFVRENRSQNGHFDDEFVFGTADGLFIADELVEQIVVAGLIFEIEDAEVAA